MLIEHSFSRHLYNSMDRLVALLNSSDMVIVQSVLALLYTFRWDYSLFGFGKRFVLNLPVFQQTFELSYSPSR
jgi:hypothetical protein